MRNSIERRPKILFGNPRLAKGKWRGFPPLLPGDRVRRGATAKVLAAATSNPKSASSHCQRNSKERACNYILPKKSSFCWLSYFNAAAKLFHHLSFFALPFSLFQKSPSSSSLLKCTRTAAKLGKVSSSYRKWVVIYLEVKRESLPASPS